MVHRGVEIGALPGARFLIWLIQNFYRGDPNTELGDRQFLSK